MPNTNKTESQLQKELLETVQEVGELLKKSGLAKAEDDEVGDVQPDHEEPDADNMGGPSDQDADNMPPEGAGDPNAAPAAAEGEEGGDPAAAEGAEGGGGDMQAEMAAHAAELSDEELQAMLEVLMAEVEKRHAGQAGAEGQQGMGAPQPGEGEEQLAASMKSEFSSLAKSVAEIAEAVKGLTGEVTTLKKSVATKRQTTVVSKPAATNDKNIQVMHKSNEPKQRLNKSETLKFLLSEQRNKNARVNSDVIATVNACRSDEDLAAAQTELEKNGIKFPTL